MFQRNFVKFIIIDLFCGFGGTSKGYEDARIPADVRKDLFLKMIENDTFGGKAITQEEYERDYCQVSKVIACVNHDPLAIQSHWLNHPDVTHFNEDIRTLNLSKLKQTVRYWKQQYPNALVILWASLECTNYSKAKGGQSRDADSRTLAHHLNRYVKAIKPDYVKIENVVEFMSWGPLISKVSKTDDGFQCCNFVWQEKPEEGISWKPCFSGVPESKKNGIEWVKWRNTVCELGYYDEWRELNSADFGAYTSRNRLFGCFAKKGLPIVWPTPTHAKKPVVMGSMFGATLEKWKAVKDVLNFLDEGESIFNRKIPLVDKTLERIYAGLIKFVAKGDKYYISKYYSGKPDGKNISINGPAGTVTCVDGQSLIEAQFLLQTYAANSQGHNTFSVDNPARTITTRDSTQIVQPEFIVQRNGGNPESKIVDVNGPSRTLTATGGNQDLVQPEFLASYYGTGDNVSSVENPSPTLRTKDGVSLIQPEFLLNYNHSSDVNDINEPSPTLVTKDKLAKVKPEFFIDKHFGKNAQNQSIDEPAGVIMPTDKHRLIEAEPFLMTTNFNNEPVSVDNPSPVITADGHHHYIVNPSHGGNCTSTDVPGPVIVARQDKAPLYLLSAESGIMQIPVYDDDSEIMIKIKYFMVIYKLKDIKMRMLRVPELLRIQGFPEDYKMVGKQKHHKKFIGNSVVPLVVQKWAEAFYEKLTETGHFKQAA